MKRKNLVAMVTSVALVGVVAVGGTLALLTSPSGTVTNTFTIGNGYPEQALSLHEAVVEMDKTTSNYGGWVAKEDGSRDYDGQSYSLVANTTVDKDPTFTLKANSPDSWIVAYVDGIDELNSKVDVTTIPGSYNWAYLGTNLDATIDIDQPTADTLADGYYVFKNPVAGGNSTQALFDQLTVQNEALGENLAGITVKGVAVESVTGDWAQDGAAVVAQIGETLN